MILRFSVSLLMLVHCSSFLSAQTKTFDYDLDVSPNGDDAFHLTLALPPLTAADSIYSFVSFAPGVHQPLDFGRFVKAFKVFDNQNQEIAVRKKGLNDWKIAAPERAVRIEYQLDDSFDMDLSYHGIYAMTATGITEKFAIINSHGVFGYFQNLKSSPVRVKVNCKSGWKIGTALPKETDGYYRAETFYQLADSPILAGELSFATQKIGDIEVEAFVYSPNKQIDANAILRVTKPVLDAAYKFTGFAAVKKYTFLMYLNSPQEARLLPLLDQGGALEHSYSSTYALPAEMSFLPQIRDIIAHEFMHILTPLNLRSEVIANFDYSRPTSEDQHLWLYEGVTEWVAHIMQLRSGNITLEDYLKVISEKIERSEQFGSAYSLVRLSHEWSTEEGNRYYGNIYALGALTAGAMDLKLLELSGGKRGLREVYIELIKKFGKDKPFSNAGFFDELVADTYPEMRGFIDNYLKGALPLDYKTDFKLLGINYLPQQLSKDKRSVLGFEQSFYQNKFIVYRISPELKDFGLKKWDTIEEIFGEKITQENAEILTAKAEMMKAGDTYKLVVDRFGNRIELKGQLMPKMDYHIFSIDTNATPTQKAFRENWLRNN